MKIVLSFEEAQGSGGAGLLYSEEIARCMRVTYPERVVYPIDVHAGMADLRTNCGTSNTLIARMGTGGGNVPMILVDIINKPEDQ